MLTSQDLNQIKKIMVEVIHTQLTNKINQILEYTNEVRDAHEEWRVRFIRDKNRG